MWSGIQKNILVSEMCHFCVSGQTWSIIVLPRFITLNSSTFSVEVKSYLVRISNFQKRKTQKKDCSNVVEFAANLSRVVSRRAALLQTWGCSLHKTADRMNTLTTDSAVGKFFTAPPSLTQNAKVAHLVHQYILF